SVATAAVSALVTAAGISDIDPTPLSGIAVTLTSGTGTWQYSTDGTNYFTMGATGDANARFLASTAFVRYTPGANENGNATITYRAWDQTSGTSGSLGSAAV